jgi:glycosyltransferase involved in cell wall biosynthesis
MKILILNWRDLKHPKAGGAEIATHEHAKAWVQASHQVTQFSSSFPGAKKEENINGVKIIRRGREFLTVHLLAFIYYLWKLRKQCDLIVDEFHGIPFFTPLYSRKKKLVFIHEVAKEVWFLNHLPRPMNWIVGGLGYLLEPLIFRLLYRKTPFITVSESTKKDLISWNIPPKNISVIHNGVRVVIPKPMPKKEKKPTIIFLGPLTRDKGIEAAIQAFAEISKKVKSAQFWVVGKGDKKYSEKLKKKSEQLKLGGKICFFGYVEEKKKFELLARAHVLINSSVREGWGLVVIETAAMGTPIVGFDVPGLRDSIIHNKTGLICQENNSHSLASNVIKLLENKKKYTEIQKNAILWSKNFSWDKAAKASLSLIEDLS